jgi:hypothetical protein
VIWPQCRSLGECSFGEHPPSVVALPLDANGVAITQNPTKISTRLCEPHGYVNVDGPNTPTVSPTDTGYIVSWEPQEPGLGCMVLRAIGPTGTPSGPEVMVSRRPSGLRRAVAPFFSSQQTCSYQGGQRILATWLVGEGTGDGHPVSNDLRYYGLYRQVFGNKGQLIGKDTRGVRSIADVAPSAEARFGSESVLPFRQTVEADPWQDRCVVFATSLNRVDAYVYDQDGALRQKANLFRYHRPSEGNIAPFDLVDAVWSQNGGFLLRLHTEQANDPFTISSYPLR